MKKTVLLFIMTIILLFTSTVAVLADAMVYDTKSADYYVKVKTPDGGLNMRHGPGADYDKVTNQRIPDNAVLYIGMTSGSWGYTSYNGNEGWVYLPQTVKTSAPNAAPDVKEAGYHVYVKTPDGGLNLRSGPGVKNNTVMSGRIPDDTQLYIEYTSGSWGYTYYNGYEGWVALSQTTTTEPKASVSENQTANQPSQSEELPTVQQEENPSRELSNTEAEKTKADSKAVKESLDNQFILIAILIIFVIIAALIIVLVINLNSKK